MKIRVSYSELKSGPGYNNRRAEAEIEMDQTDIQINGGIDTAFDRIWQKAREEVKRQMGYSTDECPY